MKHKFFNGNKGIAMLMLIIFLAIMSIFCVTALYISRSSSKSIDTGNTTDDALHIAEAGYNKYLWFLNSDPTFYKDSDGDSGQEGVFVPMPDPDGHYTSADNQAWAGFPKKYKVTTYRNGPVTLGYFQVSIIPPSTGDPAVTVISTGWTEKDPSIKRSIRVKLLRRQFTNFVRLDGDTLDENGNPIWLTSVYDGPYFTNGTLRISGTPTFKSDVGYVVGIINNGNPNFEKSGQPQKLKPLVFPTSNSSLKTWGQSVNGGYTFTGRTCIKIDGSTLYIRNKNISSDAIQTLPLPTSGVIYINNGRVFISGTLNGRLTILADQAIYITSKDPTQYTFTSIPTNARFKGLQYEDQSIPTTANASYTCDDMLGLVSNSSILVNSQYWPSTNTNGYITAPSGTNYALTNITIQAAMLGISNTSYFGVDNYSNLPSKGSIDFTGSISCQLIGGKSSGSSGYTNNNYSYDYRMLYDTPPHFLQPENSGWEVKQWNDLGN